MSNKQQPARRLTQLRQKCLWKELVPGPFLTWLETIIINGPQEYYIDNTKKYQLLPGWQSAMVTENMRFKDWQNEWTGIIVS